MVTRACWAWLVWAGCNPTYIPPLEDDCEVLDGAICLDGTLGDSDTDTDVDATQPGGETGLDALEVVSVTIQPSSGVVNTSVLTCEVTVTPDPSGVSVAYAWSNETTSTALGDEPELVLDASLALPGDEVKCAVTASDGMHSDDGEASVTVGNRRPEVDTPTLSPDPFFNDSTVTCSASASDPDGTTPTVTYAWSNQTTSSGLGSGFSLTLTPSAALPGHEIRCTATASDGSLTAEASVTGTVGARAGDALPHSFLGTLRYVPAGEFTMGCVVGRDDVADVVCDPPDSSLTERELPTRTVTLTTALWMMESELTQGMWTGLGFTNPSFFSGSTKPVERVNWWEALEVANEASRRDGLAECYTLTGCNGNAVGADRQCTGVTVTSASGHPKDCEGWRLPTEAEWEYAARADTSFPYSGGSDVNEVAWYGGNNSPIGTKAACSKPTPRNAWGLCDMSGNVWEWTWDRSADDYNGAATTDPTGPASGSLRRVRGGNWSVEARLVRVADRSRGSPGFRGNNLGFRLVRSVP